MTDRLKAPAAAPRHAALSAALARFALPALGVFGAALILLREANYGVGLTADSGLYVSAARSLVTGDGFVLWNGSPYAGAAPLFPLLLTAVGLFGIDVIDAAGYVNAAAFGLTVFASAAWLKSHVRSPLLAVWAGCACALSPALANAAAHAWTEIVFILLTVVSLSLLDRFLRRGKTPVLLLAAAAAAAACMTRYVGAVLIGAGGLVLLLRTGAGFRTRVRDAALWSVAALAPVSAWIVRNLLVIEAPIGILSPDRFSALLSLHRATGEFALWLFGPTGFDLLNRALGSVTGIDLAAAAVVNAVVAKAALLVAAAVGAGYALARYRSGFLRRRRTVLTVATVFVAAYALFLAAYLPLTDVALPVRYLLPLFPPLLVVTTLVLDEFMAPADGKWLRVVLAVVMSLWLAQQAAAAWSATRAWLEHGSGYAAGAQESETIRYLNSERLEDASRVWSSNPSMLYFHTELQTVSTISRSLDDVIAQLVNWDSAEPAYFVLFRLSFRYRIYDYGIDELGTLPGVELVADLEDGVIFRRGSAAAPADPAAAVRDQVVAARFDVYVYGDSLAYFKEPCTAEDVRAKFFLHLIPADAAVLPAYRRQSGFEGRDFHFSERGLALDGRCLAVVGLPDYRLRSLETGQYISASGQLWNVTLTGHRLRLIPYRSAYRSVRAGNYGAAKVRSTFDLYADGRALIYLRNPCALEDVSDPFFLHVVPADLADLPAHRRRLQSDFDNLDFSFAEQGAFLGGTCVAVAALPDYGIARIRTGQHVPGEGNLWESSFEP